MTQGLTWLPPARLALGLPTEALGGARDSRARGEAPRGQYGESGVQLTLALPLLRAVPCPDPSLGKRAKPVDFWELRSLRSDLASADRALTTVYPADVDITEAARLVRETAAELMALSSLVKMAVQAKRGRR